jgi:hypothetical protein
MVNDTRRSFGLARIKYIIQMVQEGFVNQLLKDDPALLSKLEQFKKGGVGSDSMMEIAGKAYRILEEKANKDKRFFDWSTKMDAVLNKNKTEI